MTHTIPPINKDRAVCGAAYHIGGHLGCATVWFETPEAASAAYRRLGYVPSGRDAGKCAACKVNYKDENARRRAPYQYACETYKEGIAGCSQK